MANKLNAKDTLSAALAECFITIDGNRYNFMQATDLEAKSEITKKEVPILGQTAAGNKQTGVKYSGSATFYFNTSIFRDMLYKLQETGEATYFDMQITNEDKTATVGRQTVILKDCLIDGGIIAKFKAGEDVLEEELDFTFERFEIPEKFNKLTGM